MKFDAQRLIDAAYKAGRALACIQCCKPFVYSGTVDFARLQSSDAKCTACHKAAVTLTGNVTGPSTAKVAA